MMLLATLAFALTSGVFILTQSRSAYIGLAVGLIAFGVSRSRWFLVALLVLAVMASALVWSVGVEESIDSLLPVESARIAVGRFEIWRRAVYLMRDFPYTGVGLNTFPYVGDAMYPYPSQGLSARVPHAHNNLLQVGVDLGIPGLIAYVGLLAAFTLCAWRVHRASGSRSSRLLAAGLFSGMLAHQVFGLTDAITLGAKPGFILWIMFGLMAALYRTEVDSSERFRLG
jgi:putative inorganic carbon (HCO3(-)) transporter